MLLKNLLSTNIEYQIFNEDPKLEVSSIEIDSRRVGQNSVFFALKGKDKNGADFIKSAIKNGAKVIICDEKEDLETLNDVILIKTRDQQALLVCFLQKFYSKLPKNIFAVTGTNGKTSVAEFSRQILEILGKKAAVIGTLGVTIADDKIKKKLIDNHLTTPDIVTFYQNLEILKEKGIDFVIVEASSIGLEQGRLDGIGFKAAAFTNFTQDHLDYHKTMESYFEAKMLLFSQKFGVKLAILNQNDTKFSKIEQICFQNDAKMVSYGSNDADFAIKTTKITDDFQEISLLIKNKEYNFKIALLEDFQGLNVICALAMISSYLDLDAKNLQNLTEKLQKLTPPQGRMEKVAVLENNAKIYIDFAHTPDALENILKTARKLTKSRLLVLFGCGGDRDNSKRAIMGEVSEKLADFAIITDDNPRTEDPKLIRSQIISGIKNKDKFIEISDRKEAIKQAIPMLKNNEILIIAGKGHENYQIIGKNKVNFDEKGIINEFFEN